MHTFINIKDIVIVLNKLKCKMVKSKITLTVNKEALKIIDEGAKKEFCSRSNFLIRNGLKAANEVLKE